MRSFTGRDLRGIDIWNGKKMALKRAAMLCQPAQTWSLFKKITSTFIHFQILAVWSHNILIYPSDAPQERRLIPALSNPFIYSFCIYETNMLFILCCCSLDALKMRDDLIKQNLTEKQHIFAALYESVMEQETPHKGLLLRGDATDLQQGGKLLQGAIDEGKSWDISITLFSRVMLSFVNQFCLSWWE